MIYNVGGACIDENGKISGGKTGDQNGKEVRIHPWYDYPWNCYIEFPDKNISLKAAILMEIICGNENIGYDQSKRSSVYYSIINSQGKTIEDKAKNAIGSVDCSSLVSLCYKLAGVNVRTDNSTFTMRHEFMNAGFNVFTDYAHVHTPKKARRGGIYLSDMHHVVMVLQDGEYIDDLMIGCKGDDVKTLQTKLVKIGYNLVIDGDFWAKTEQAVKSFQVNNSLPVNGVVNKITMNTMDAMLNRLEPRRKKTWVEIITSSGLERQDEWLKAIEYCKSSGQYQNSILRFLPELIEKIGNK